MASSRSVLRWALAVALTAVALGAAGCVGKCPTCSATPVTTCGNADLNTRLKVAAAMQAAPVAPEVLMLSGGGSYGAWGAGILNGWTQHLGGDRPEFEVVTGSSTGAILGTWAFLGESFDGFAKDAYTQTEGSDVYIDFPWLWLQPWRWFSRTTRPWSAIKNLAPLRETLEAYTPPAQVAQVAAIYASASPRVFLVGTTNLETGNFCTWDMGKIAAPLADSSSTAQQKQDAYRAYIDKILASSANPIVFNPFYIDDVMHVDGGVRHQIFAWDQLRGPMLDGLRARTPLIGSNVPGACGSVADPRPPQVFAIVNGPLTPRRMCVPDDVVHIAQRALTVMQMEAMIGNLYRAREQFAPELPTDPAWKFCASHVPHDYDAWAFADEFPKTKMGLMFQAAFDKAKLGLAWSEQMPKSEISTLPCVQPL